jgi:hypothetical protein
MLGVMMLKLHRFSLNFSDLAGHVKRPQIHNQQAYISFDLRVSKLDSYFLHWNDMSIGVQ